MTLALPTFPALLQRFFTQRLMQQKRVSAHTIRSYRDTFRLLLCFARKRLRTSPDRLAFEKIDAPFISAFLSEIEKTRGVGARTRNLRLTATRQRRLWPRCCAPSARSGPTPDKSRTRTPCKRHPST